MKESTANLTSQYPSSPDFKAVLENSPNGVAILKAIRNEADQIVDFEYVFMNQTGLSIINRGNLIGQRLLTIFPEQLENNLFASYVKVVETQTPETIEIFYGAPYDAWAHITAIPVDNGISLSFQDISKRKKAELAESENTKRLKAFIENLPGGAAHRLGDSVTINQKVKEMLGYAQEEITDIDTWFQLVHKDHYKEARELYEAGRASGFQNSEVIPFWTKAGKMLWVRMTAQVYAAGEVWLMQDITEQKIAEEALKQYSEQLEQLVTKRTETLKQAHQDLERYNLELEEAQRLAKVGSWEWDLQTNEVKWSEQLFRILGASRAEKVALDQFFLYVHPEDLERVKEVSAQVAREKRSIPTEYRIRTPEGQVKYVFGTGGYEMKNEKGEVVKLFGIVQDITARKKVELALVEALKKEKELSELKSRFVSMASHEFRTPLATILTSVSLIDSYRDASQPEKQVKHIDRIKSNVQNMRNILDDFLSLSKLEEGKIELKLANIELVPFFNELVEELQSHLKEGQSLIYDHKSDETGVLLDPQLLQNICNNLISNAIKYSGEGKDIFLNSYIEQHEVKLEVIDQGIGIPEEDQKYMFTRFFRAKNAANIKGTGLGLTIVRRYVELMQGRISFVSKPDHGSTFVVAFPRNASMQ